MTVYWELSFVCFVLFVYETSCYPVGQVRVPRNEVQYPNGTVVGAYTYKDGTGSPISVKYYADKKGYGVELNSFKTLKVIDTSTTKEPSQNPKPVKDYMEPVAPLLDLAAEIMKFDNKFNKPTDEDTTVKQPDTFNHFQHVTNLITPNYERFYQNEVKAPKQCERDKVRVYLAKENRKKKNAEDDTITKASKNKG